MRGKSVGKLRSVGRNFLGVLLLIYMRNLFIPNIRHESKKKKLFFLTFPLIIIIIIIIL